MNEKVIEEWREKEVNDEEKINSNKLKIKRQKQRHWECKHTKNVTGNRRKTSMSVILKKKQAVQVAVDVRGSVKKEREKVEFRWTRSLADTGCKCCKKACVRVKRGNSWISNTHANAWPQVNRCALIYDKRLYLKKKKKKTVSCQGDAHTKDVFQDLHYFIHNLEYVLPKIQSMII